MQITFSRILKTRKNATFPFFTAILLLIFSLGTHASISNSINALKESKWPLENMSVRARFAERTFLGNDAPENFNAFDFSANFKLPYTLYKADDWELGTNLMASVGMLKGFENSALVASAVPELILRSNTGLFTANAGFGLAAFSRHKFGIQDFGGPVQFAITFGATWELSKYIRMGYRFQHYSDGRTYGRDTIGADLHMIELYYQFK